MPIIEKNWNIALDRKIKWTENGDYVFYQADLMFVNAKLWKPCEKLNRIFWLFNGSINHFEKS